MVPQKCGHKYCFVVFDFFWVVVHFHNWHYSCDYSRNLISLKVGLIIYVKNKIKMMKIIYIYEYIYFKIIHVRQYEKL